MKRKILVAALLGFSVVSRAQSTRLVSGVDIPEPYCKADEALDCETHQNLKGELEGLQTCHFKYLDHGLAYEASYKAGKLDGTVRCWLPGSNPVLEAEFKNGLMDGKMKTSWESKLGMWTHEKDYRAGVADGFSNSKFVEYSGNKARVTGEGIRMYKEGKEQGFSLAFEGGKLVSFGDCLVMGERQAGDEPCQKISHGRYDEELKRLKSQHALKQEKDCGGSRKRYHSGFRFEDKTETLIEVFEQKDCLKQGKSVLYRQDEKTKLVETTFVKDKREGEQLVFFPEGGLSERLIYKSDLPIHIEAYFQNGKKKSDVEVKSKDRWTLEAIFKLYDDLGTLREKGQSRGDLDRTGFGSYPGVSDVAGFSKRMGCHFIYDEKGVEMASDCHDDAGLLDGPSTENTEKEKFERSYKHGVLVIERAYDLKTGKLKHTTEFFPDGSRKSQKVEPSAN